MESETDFESDLTDGDFEIKSKINLKLDSIKRHRCPYDGCYSAFNRPWKLERHINSHTKNRPFKCDFPGCTKDYTNNSHLKRHKSLSHAKNKPPPVYIDCPFPDCNKTFSNKWNLKKHCNLHRADNSYKCDLCGSTFKKHRQLKNHMSIHLGVKPFTCQACSDTFEHKRELKKHEKKHKKYPCDEADCQQVFETFHGLRAHRKTAHPKWLECDFCGTTYKNKYTLTEHILSHLPKESREILVCPQGDCGRYYFYQRNLNHHIKSYHQNINHLCTICQETFVNKSKLENHYKLHAEPKDNSETITKSKKPRKPRKDKGLRRKSMAAILSGIQLPDAIDKNLAQNNITPEVCEYIENMMETLNEEITSSETSQSVT